MTQFGLLDQMQGELDARGLDLEVNICGVNQVGSESGNATMCAGKTLPWLQDTATDDAWGLWQISSRDVVVLDQQNEVLTIYNLNANPLTDPANYAALSTILEDAATN